MSTEKVEAVDHAAEAAQGLRNAEAAAERGHSDVAVVLIREADAHASLAIAQQLERLNEQLEKGAIEVMYGGRMV